MALTDQFLETFVTGNDPSVVNANPPLSNIVIETDTVTNHVTIPEYSVVRLEWTIFNVPQPMLTIASTPSSHTLTWTGLTNVTYAVQGTTNFGSWATLGKVADSQTNFRFTDFSSGTLQFYRLTVP